MTQPNPFAPTVPAAAEQQPNPFGQQPAAPAAVQQYAPPAQQQPAAVNPFGAPQGQPPAPAQAYAPAQPVAPQQYAPPAGGNPFAPQQQYAAPAPGAVQAYAPPAAPVQQYAPQQQAPAAPPQLGTLAAAPPPVAGGGRGPKLPDMYGRLVIAFPHSLKRVPRRPEHITAEQRAAGNVDQDQMTVTFVVLDSGPGTPPGTGFIDFGGAPHALPPTPHTDREMLPYIRKGMWINQSRLIGQLRDFMPGAANSGPHGSPGMVCGRLVKTGPESNAPWFLTTATAEELTTAGQYLSLVAEGRYPHPLA